MKVRGDEIKMYCANLRQTLKDRESFIHKWGEKALIEAARKLGIYR